MESPHYEEKKKWNRRFVLIYAGTIILMSLLFGAFWLYYHPANRSDTQKISANEAEVNYLVERDAMLHENLRKIDDLEMQYANLIMESADSSDLDSLDVLITDEETSFGNMLDRLYNDKNMFSDSENEARSDSIIFAFLSELSFRKSNHSFLTVFMKSNTSKDTNLVSFLHYTIANKDDTINHLRKEVNIANTPGMTIFPPFQSSAGENLNKSVSQSLLQKKSDSIENLLYLYSGSLKESRDLATQLSQLRSENKTVTTAAVEKGKIEDLNNKVDDLYAELALAKVDCNLTRANGKEIIYNSKQRKDLLETSLRTLKNLAVNDNPVIQRKVKEKMQLLKDIAATVRD